ncbi:MAG: lysophospholipase L1-like esterase, partial [Chlamydiales bacterium]
PPRGPGQPGSAQRPTRVLLFGGSNTDKFPYGRLQQFLNEAGGHWEVINLGRSGYGSARVSILLEQALDRLAPDVVVLYTGHNEFVEQSFERDLEQEWSGPVGQRIGRWAAGSHVVTGVRSLLASAAPAAAGKRPEAWKWEYDKFKGLTYPETLKVYERYGENLEQMCRTALDRQVGVLLCTVVHNHYAAPFESTLPADWPPARVEEFNELRDAIQTDFPAWLRPLAPLEARDRVISGDWQVPADRRRQPPLPPMELGARTCLGPLADAPAKRPNRKRWSEKAWSLLEALEQLRVRDLGPEREHLERLVSRLEEALELCPEHPLSHFELGLMHLALGGDPELIATHFEAAARFDRAPRRGNGATNDILRDIAARSTDVVLLDAAQLFSERMPMGLVGWEWMSDHCHLNPGACLVFMADLAQVLQQHWR